MVPVVFSMSMAEGTLISMSPSVKGSTARAGRVNNMAVTIKIVVRFISIPPVNAGFFKQALIACGVRGGIIQL
jgi:hypothetical protein